jgi:PAS domain-containing protein/GNAT superfamily N-acetyltransferase/two-component sensor histidine kinase
MKIGYLFDTTQPLRRNRFWALAGITIVAIAANIFSLGMGITIVFSHILYFPIILAGYWYPKRGVEFSVGLSAVYGAMVILFFPPESLLVLTVLSRCIIFIVIGVVVSFLSSKLRKSEQQLLDIIEFLPDATFAIDNKGVVIAWNKAIENMTGIKKSQMLGRGNYEYSLPFYGVRRPILADLILKPDPKTEAKYPFIKKESGKLISEIYLPHFHNRATYLRFAAIALADVDGHVTGAIESIRDVTDKVMTETALQNTSSRLNILAGIIRNDIAKKLAVMYGHLTVGVMKFNDPNVLSFISSLQESANGIQRQIEISREFRDIGTTPPAWMPVQEAVLDAAARIDFKEVTFRAWAGRLEIFTDPHLSTVFYHLFENSKKEGTGATRVVVTYHIHDKICTILIEDDGLGIPDPDKESLFSRRSEIFGCGLFLAHEILTLTGMSVRENGVAGKGTRFEILIPPEGYRIINTGQTPPTTSENDPSSRDHAKAAGVAEDFKNLKAHVQELSTGKFPLADKVWLDYHETKGIPAQDRIFAVFLGEKIVSLARCRRHSDGMEVDGIFTPPEYRRKGYSRIAVNALTEACHNDTLYMHAVTHLLNFYRTCGFEPIQERDLPPTIRERYIWAAGNLEGAQVQPMCRKAGF